MRYVRYKFLLYTIRLIRILLYTIRLLSMFALFAYLSLSQQDIIITHHHCTSMKILFEMNDDIIYDFKHGRKGKISIVTLIKNLELKALFISFFIYLTIYFLQYLRTNNTNITVVSSIIKHFELLKQQVTKYTIIIRIVN